MNLVLVGSNDVYYFLVGYDINKCAYFLKTPVDFFDFIDMEQPHINILIDVEVYVNTYFEELIEDGLLTIIPIKEIFEGD